MKWINEEYEPTDANIYSAECSICGSIAIAYGKVSLSYQFCPCCGEPVEKEEKRCNDLEIIHDYFISVYKHYTANKNDCISDIAKLSSKIKNESDCALKYYLEMERETIIEKLHYYTAVLTFVNGTLKLIDKELHKIK